ncbi:MAG: hypothetical protein OXC40_03230 [Proteobacteria bacterium]|nr:hypothetical protein [Pseudomonadota bacterium]
MKHLSLLLLSLLIMSLASSCAMFGGGESDMEMEENEFSTDETYDTETDNSAFSSNEYGGENNLYGDFSPDDDDASGDFAGDDGMGYSGDAVSSSGVAMGGQVYFVQSMTNVTSSPGGQALYVLHQGDSIRGEPAGEYTMIGMEQYVLTAALSQGPVARVAASNPWR